MKYIPHLKVCIYVCLYINYDKQLNTINLPASRTYSYRAQFALLASVSAPRARDLIVAPRAPFFLDIFSKSQNLFLSLSETGNSIYLRLYRPLRKHSHRDTRALRSIFSINFSNFNKHITYLG